ARFPVTAGVNWRCSLVVHPGAGAWSTVTTRVRWYDTDDNDLGPSTGTTYAIPGTSWYALPSDAVAPAGATQAAVEIVATAGATGSILHVDAVALWEVLPLTAVTADSNRGHAPLTLRELPLDYTISVYRVGADGARTLVRGTSGMLDRQTITADLLIVEDHEVPLGRQAYYYIELHSPGGSRSTRSSSPVLLTLDDTNEAWLKDPGNPQRNMRVLVQAAPDWQRPIEQATLVVRGRRNKVTLSGRRQGLEGELAIYTRSDEEREDLHLLLDSGSTLLWQAMPGAGVDDMYVAVGQI